mgnify:CR=1 FL=1
MWMTSAAAVVVCGLLGMPLQQYVCESACCHSVVARPLLGGLLGIVFVRGQL